MNRFFLISIGAVLGANARYLIGVWATSLLGPTFPFGTLLVNTTGSLLMGFLVAFSSSHVEVPADLRIFLGVGFLGSYTTFSSLAVESVLLLQDGDLYRGLLALFGNIAIGIGCALLGVYLASALPR